MLKSYSIITIRMETGDLANEKKNVKNIIIFFSDNFWVYSVIFF